MAIHLKNIFTSIVSLLLVFSLASCSAGAIPGGGKLGAADISGVVHVPEDEPPLKETAEGSLVRAPIVREDAASESVTYRTFSGSSN